MTYTHLTPNELVMIDAYVTQKMSVTHIANVLGRARQTIYNVCSFLLKGNTAHDYFEQYKQNKRNCGRKLLQLPEKQRKYIVRKVAEGWTPDVIIGRSEQPIACSVRILYRQFKRGVFDCTSLPMKGKRIPNAHNNNKRQTSF